MVRVTKPGGRVVVLEITTPQRRRCRGSSGPGSTGSCLCSAASPGTPMPTRTCRTACAASRTRNAGGQHGRGRPHRRPLDPHGGRHHRDPLGYARRVNTAQAQLGAVLAAGGPELTRLLERTEERLARGGSGPRRRARRARRRHAVGRWASGCARSSSSCAEPAAPTGSCRQPRRSSCCTWRRSCTTTCSTAPSCAAAGPPCSPRPAVGRPRHRRPALLAAFAELAHPGAEDAVRALSAASSRSRAASSCSAPTPGTPA